MIKQILGKKVKIPYKKQLIEGREIFKWLVVGSNGYIYRSDWEPDFAGLDTPLKRRLKRFSREEVKWHRHDSLGSVQRAFMQSVLKGEMRLEQYSGLVRTAEGKLRAEVIKLKDAGKDLFVFKLILEEIFGQIKRSAKKSMRESRQIMAGLAKQGVPTGAKLAQTTALEDRFEEEFFSLLAWVPEYLGRNTALVLIINEIDKRIAEMEKQTTLEARHEAVSRGKTSRRQVQILHHKFQMRKKELNELSVLKQFREWAFLMLKDIETVDQLVLTENLINAGPIMIRMRESAKVKKIQLDIEKLLALIDFDLARKCLEWDIYGEYLFDYVIRLKAINEIGFEVPVCHQALEIMEPILEKIQADKKSKQPDISSLKKFKEEIKEAYWLL